jgi:hypothetical protein
VDAVLDYCEQTTRFLLEQGHRAAFCLPGYHKCLEYRGASHFKEGVYLLGRNRTDRRSKVAQKLNAKYVDTRRNPEKRGPLFLAPGIHLNIHRERTVQTFGAIKIIQMYLANKCFVISEPHWWSPLTPGIHYIEATEENLPGVVKHYKRRAEKRKEIARNGYLFTKKYLQMTRFLRRALQVLDLL